MRTKLITSNNINSHDCENSDIKLEVKEYECMCGKGKIIEEHDHTIGFKESEVWIACDNCKNEYVIDTSKGIRKWELVKKDKF